MANGHGPNILGPDGQPLRPPEPKLVVLKTPKGVGVKPQLVANLGKATGCNVINLPMDSELMMGQLAYEEILSIHTGIHAILELPNVSFTRPELECIRHSLKTNTAPELGSEPAVSQILNKVDEVLV